MVAMKQFFKIYGFEMLAILTLPIVIYGFAGKAEKSSFEGVITYSVSLNIKVENEFSDYTRRKFGNEMKFYWNSSGDLKRETKGSGFAGLEYSIIKNEENINYLKYRGIDTLYFYDCTENLDSLIYFEKGGNERILGAKCKSIYSGFKSNFDNEIVNVKYFYANRPWINSELFNRINDGFANMYYSKAESPYMKMDIEYKYHRLIYRAIDIETKELDESTFELPDLPKVEF